MAEFKFSVDSALLSEIGERLVEREYIAILELVKNSYDADATEVQISFTKKNKGYVVVIEDNGIGMSFEQVQKYWMRIATTNKDENRISEVYGRKKGGSKGIGRFSCRRLGEKLILITTAQLQNRKFQRTEIEFDWLQFKSGTDVSEIVCDGNTSISPNNKTGTKLLIYSNRETELNLRDWKALKRQLILLVSNRGKYNKIKQIQDPGFNMILNAPDFESEKIVNPREQLMNASWGRIQLDISKDGSAKWDIIAKKINKKNITMKKKYPLLAGTKADIAIIPVIKQDFREPSLIKLTDLKKSLNEWGGVFIRKDNLRVTPYGEGDNDWLDIDKDRARRLAMTKYNPIKDLALSLKGVDPRRALLSLLSAKAHVGEVNVKSPDDLFEMKTSREGFIGTEPIKMLKEVIRFGVEWATIYRDYFLRLKTKEEVILSRQILKENINELQNINETMLVEKVVSYLNKEVKNIATSLPKKEKKEIISNVSNATDYILNKNRYYKEELKHMRLIASTSSLLLIFQHEVKSLLGTLDSFNMQLETLKPKIDDESSAQVNDIQNDLVAKSESFKELLNMTTLLTNTSEVEEPEELALKKRIKKAVSIFDLIIKQYKIQVDINEIPNDLKIGPITTAELFSIILNILSNSIKAVIANKTKKIKFYAKKENKKVRLIVCDDGIGVDYNDKTLFSAFIADPNRVLYKNLKAKINPEDNYIVGTGSGLGLSIVNEIVTSYKGSARFVEPDENWKTKLEIIL
jgi:signal transduction histidine kinase